MVESGCLIEYCGSGYMQMQAVVIVAAVSMLLAFGCGFFIRGLVK